MSLRGRIVGLDVGHYKGVDPGAVDPIDLKHGDKFNTAETDVNNNIAYEIKTRLEQKGAKVVLTKDPNLYERVNKAVKGNADISVSIHQNSSTNDNAEGREILATGEPKSVSLANLVEQQIALKIPTQKSRGIKFRGDLAVLNQCRRHNIPAILIEYLFISNVKEEGLAHEAGFQKLAAEGTVAGIEKYFALH